ncbi:phage portal protein, partial [Sporichthya brevicatena]|uniref:phage portal protein n=1 Tax=Sporichthya brevicatena TaxID=171442 RepID=UPI003CD06B02
MPKTLTELGDTASELLAEYRAQRQRLATIHAYMTNRKQDIYVPRSASREYRALVDQARFNVLPLVVSTVAQALYVDGYRQTGPDGLAVSSANADVWDKVWQPNRMDARQAALYRAALTYGWSYCLVEPGEPVPVLTPYSPRDAVAI